MSDTKKIGIRGNRNNTRNTNLAKESNEMKKTQAKAFFKSIEENKEAMKIFIEKMKDDDLLPHNK